MPTSFAFRFKTPMDGPSGLFTVDDSGLECYPQVYLDGKPLDQEGFFNGVCTFDAGKVDRECGDCGELIGSRDIGFLFDTGEVCERCAGIEWVEAS